MSHASASPGPSRTGAASRDRIALPDLIETDRLLLRPWRFTDVENVLAYAQDPEWSRYLPTLPQPYTRADAERFIARQLLTDRVRLPSWAIVLGDVAIGGVNLRFHFDHYLAELGYSLARQHWNKGYATEAARAVVDTAFSTYDDLNRVRAMADVRNTASQRLMEKVGMKLEGVLRQNRYERGELIDEAWFGILRSEWQERASASG